MSWVGFESGWQIWDFSWVGVESIKESKVLSWVRVESAGFLYESESSQPEKAESLWAQIKSEHKPWYLYQYVESWLIHDITGVYPRNREMSALSLQPLHKIQSSLLSA